MVDLTAGLPAATIVIPPVPVSALADKAVQASAATANTTTAAVRLKDLLVTC